jgi:hypothetical protein
MHVPFLRHMARVALCWVLITSGLPVAADNPRASQIEQIHEECIPPFFGDSGVPRAIDSANTGCGLGGEPDLDTPAGQAKQDAQNQVKNHFCAWQQSTEPALVTRKSFDQLQSQLPDGVPFGTRTNMPTAEQRELLREFYTTTEGDIIGEGSYVQFAAYILEGHFGGGESVNCGRTKRADVDIHLALVTVKPTTLDLKNRGPVECSSITAELSPHRRPIEWDILGRMTKTPAAQKLTGAQEKLKDENLQRPLRIRGQLMFDASHSLCKGGQPTKGNPPRRSGWEIHPVYSIDVCTATTLATCKVSREDVWVPLTDWLKGDDGF